MLQIFFCFFASFCPFLHLSLYVSLAPGQSSCLLQRHCGSVLLWRCLKLCQLFCFLMSTTWKDPPRWKHHPRRRSVCAGENALGVIVLNLLSLRVCVTAKEGDINYPKTKRVIVCFLRSMLHPFSFFGPTRNHELHLFWALPWWRCSYRKWPHCSPAIWLGDWIWWTIGTTWVPIVQLHFLFVQPCFFLFRPWTHNRKHLRTKREDFLTTVGEWQWFYTHDSS